MYKNRLSFFPPALYGHTYTVILLLFLAVIGSHFLDYHLFGPIIVGLFLVKWEKLPRFHTLLVTLFILSIYITWVFLDPRLIHQANLAYDIFSRGILVWLMYLIGLSIPFKEKEGLIHMKRKHFYILFGIVLTYAAVVIFSALLLHQDTPLSGTGMFVLFPNPYQMAQVNGGRLISTILTYYLTTMTFLLPLILLFYGWFRKKGFRRAELSVLVFLAVTTLYLAVMMGRRTTLVLLMTATLFLLSVRLVQFLKQHTFSIKKILLIITAGVLLAGFYQYSSTQKQENRIEGFVMISGAAVPITVPPTSTATILKELPVLERLSHKGLHDKRFTWWPAALRVIRDHPFGGGHDIQIAPGIHLAHNTCIDIGKAFGILPFIIVVFIMVLHQYYLLSISLSSRIEKMLKYQLILLSLGVFPVMMIEPVFNSDKTFFAYLFFLLGIMANLYLSLRKAKKEDGVLKRENM